MPNADPPKLDYARGLPRERRTIPLRVIMGSVMGVAGLGVALFFMGWAIDMREYYSWFFPLAAVLGTITGWLPAVWILMQFPVYGMTIGWLSMKGWAGRLGIAALVAGHFLLAWMVAA